ncbi:6-aminohexanoate-dimer hydrolase [Bacillus mycoides]|nr:6-aminohexanoate-dimer hydrolase [Bacillus mycoides]
MAFGMQRNWSEPPYETEWDFFIKSLQHGKTDALIHLVLLIIIITLDLVITFYYINKKK